MLAARRSAMLRSCSVEVTAPAILRAPDARVRSGPDRRGYPARDGIHIDHRRARTGDFPPVGLLGLAGPERAQVFADGLLPRPPISHLCGLSPPLRPETEAGF